MIPKETTESPINKKYLLGYISTLLIGAINLGYFTSQSILFLGLDEPYYLILGYIAGIVGNIVSGIFPRKGKHMKNVIGNILIFVACVLSLFFKNVWILSVFNIFYGAGIGILAISVPFFIREIVPAEYKTLSLASVGIMYFVGIQVNNIIFWAIVLFHTTNDHLWITFCVPIALSGLQLLLLLTVFKEDTPRWLIENVHEEKAVIEFHKIYCSQERRLKEFNITRKTVMHRRYNYPTYGEIFSNKYLRLQLKGIFLVIARNATENFILLGVEDSELNTTYAKYFLIMYLSLSVIIIIAPFFLVNKLTMKQSMIIGYIPICISTVVFSIFVTIGNFKEISFQYIVTDAMIFLEWLAQGIFTSPITFKYMIEILPERGFTLIMASHWITATLINIPYYLDREQIFTPFFTIFFITCAYTTLIFSWKWLENEEEKKVENEQGDSIISLN